LSKLSAVQTRLFYTKTAIEFGALGSEV